jgi:hypothetical protein
MQAQKVPIEITEWDFILTTQSKIDSNNYESIKQKIWDSAGDNIHSRYAIKEMSIKSLSFLHEVEGE